MPGTDLPDGQLTDGDRAHLVRRLTVIGWLLVGAPIGLIAFQIERVRDVGPQPFASLWEQRIEVISFLVLPPNLAALAPATFVVALAVWLAGHDRDPWLSALLTLVATIAIALAAIGVISIVSMFANDLAGASDLGGVYLRAGGVSLAAGFALVCRTADRRN